MNRAMDVFDATMTLWRTMRRADQCRFIDLCIEAYGAPMPIPALDDAYDDAIGWRETTDRQTQWAVMQAIFDGLGEAEQAKTLDALARRKKEAEQAEPPAG